MISRVSSHLLFCEPDRILRQQVVERDEDQVVTAIFSLTESLTEAANTSFYDGIISRGIVSLKLNMAEDRLAEIRKEYNYIDFSLKNQDIDLSINKELLIDFGTENVEEINLIFKNFQDLFSTFPIFDFIAACVYYPALLCDRNAVLELNKSTELILWEQLDLINKCFKINTFIRKI